MTLFDQRYQSVENQLNVAGNVRVLKVSGNPQLNVVGNVKVLNTTVQWPVSVNVPTQSKSVIGREAFINQFIERLKARENIALTGLGGVGKTTLAIALANHPAVLAHFTDGVLWGSLGQQADAMRILASWAEALGRDVSEIGNERERAQAVKNIIAEHRLLLIIDDAWSLEAANLLRCGGPYCGHLLTTRNQLIAEQFTSHAQVAKVDVLNDTLAYELLEILAPQACEVDPAAAKALVKIVGGLPLAIELLGGYLAGGKGQRQARYFASDSKVALTEVADVQRRLQLAGQRLGALDDHEISLAETIRLSLVDLPESGVQAFYALGAFAPKPEWFDLQAAEVVTGADIEIVTLLLDFNLIEIGEGERLTMHPILADVARMRTEIENKQRQRDYYLALVNEDRENWQQIKEIYGQIKWAWAVAPEDEGLFDFIGALDTYQDRRGLWSDRVNWLQRGLVVAETQERRQEEGTLLNDLGNVYYHQGLWEAAITQYEESLRIKRTLGDRHGEAGTLTNLGILYANQGHWEAAIEQHKASLKISQEFDDRWSEGNGLNNLGNVYYRQGCLEAAIAQYEASLKISQELNDQWSEGNTLMNLGNVYADQGCWETAIIQYEASLKIQRALGDQQSEGTILMNLGTVYRGQGCLEAAIAQYEASLKISQELNDQWSEGNTLMNLGNVYADQGCLEAAIAQYEASLKISQELNDQWNEGNALMNLGNVYADQGHWEAAIIQYEASLKIQRTLGNRHDESIILGRLGGVYAAQRQWEAAIVQYEASLKISRESGDASVEGACLNNLGLIYYHQGQWEAAITQYEASLKIQRTLSNRHDEGMSLMNLGSVYAVLGQKEKSMALWQEALTKLNSDSPKYKELAQWLQNVEKASNDAVLMYRDS